jgi:hypothetical protein
MLISLLCICINESFYIIPFYSTVVTINMIAMKFRKWSSSDIKHSEGFPQCRIMFDKFVRYCIQFQYDDIFDR